MYRVAWLQEALDELAEIWLAADSSLREVITAATRAIDRELKSDPFRHSESRDDANERILFVYPLGVQIEIDVQQKAVWVLHVWRFRQRRK